MKTASSILVATIGLAGIAALAWLLLATQPQPETGSDPRPARLDVSASADLEPTELSGTGQPAARAELESGLAATPFGAYRGIVLAPDGAPIQGAGLALYPTHGNWREQKPLGSATSGADGRFTISGAPGHETGRSMRILAQAEGFAGISMGGFLPEREIKIRLYWTTELFGSVLDVETNAPILGATVSYGGDSATSDARGLYRLPGVVVGQSFELKASKEGYGTQDIHVLLDEPVPTEHVIRMRRSVALRIVVIDDHTNVPLVGARVVGDHDHLFGTTDANGALEVQIAEGSELSLVVGAPGYANFVWNWDVKDASSVKAPRIPMKGVAWIEGVVTDELENPVANALLHASNAGRPRGVFMAPEMQAAQDLPGYAYWDVAEEIASDAQGHFELAVVPVDSPYSLEAGYRDYVDVNLGPVFLAEPGERAWFDVRLRKGATIRGQIRYNDQAWPGLSASVSCVDERGDSGGFARVGSDASYELTGVPAGRWTLKFRDSLSRMPPPPEAVLIVEAGKEYRQDFVWTEELVTISGRVTDVRGAPVANEDVNAMRRDDERGRRFRSDTLADGTFSVKVAPEGTYDVGVSRGPAGDMRTNVRAGAEGIELVLPDAGKLRLRLVDAATRAPITPPKSSLWGLGWRRSGSQAFAPIREEVNHDGHVELELPVGVVDLAFHLAEGGYAPRQVHGVSVSREGNVEPLVVELERGVAVKLQLSGEGSLERLRSHLLFLLHESQLDSLRGPFPEQGGPSNHCINEVNMWVGEPGLLEQMLDLEPGGSAVLRGLRPGRYTLKNFPDDFVFDPTSFELRDSDPAGEEKATVEIRWRPK